MIFTYFLSPKDKYLLKRITGPVNLDGLKEVLSNLWEDPDYHPSYKGMVDLRSAELELGVSDLSRLTKILHLDDRASYGRYAIVVQKPIDTAIAMIYESKMRIQQEIEVFHELDFALKYLNLTLEDFENLDSEAAHRVEIDPKGKLVAIKSKHS